MYKRTFIYLDIQMIIILLEFYYYGIFDFYNLCRFLQSPVKVNGHLTGGILPVKI